MINITPSADLKIKQLIENENNTTPTVIGLRVAVANGGCSGFSYAFDFVETPNSDDILIVQDGYTLVIDPVSAQHLTDATLDYKKSQTSSQFVISNPNSKGSCGCGNSFSV